MISFACSKCHWGDWAEKAPPKCTGCGGDVHVTGEVHTVKL